MAQSVTLGGDRLGSGSKEKLHLHNYYRSTHNLSQSWDSPMTPGVLYPFLVIPATRNDKFEIGLTADTITIPTKGPLFGSFKLQVDVFECPIRLYQAFLHNNPTDLGLKMNQVLLPTYQLKDSYYPWEMPHAMNNSCLWKYLGLSGIGQGTAGGQLGKHCKRNIMAVPLLAYYDIFKNYYSNKQEEKAYVIGHSINEIEYGFNYPYCEVKVGAAEWKKYGVDDTRTLGTINPNTEIKIKLYVTEKLRTFTELYLSSEYDSILDFGDINNLETINFKSVVDAINEPKEFVNFNLRTTYDGDPNYIILNIQPSSQDPIEMGIMASNITDSYTDGDKIALNAFDLKNIDEMRMEILSHHTLGSPFRVDEFDKLPYNINNLQDSQYPLNGLVLKTYQSDIFNNWVNTEWIDGENGIAELTKISTSDGAFKIDALNLAQKLYNMLNRVAVSGGTYEDWQDAVYDQAPHKHIESPIYLGGMSSEIVFEQIVSSVATATAPQGNLAGRGRHIKRKGGKVICKCEEPCFIIGIVSITPRIKYCQGNEFYLTELKSLDDLHKPALDGIGFQNLLGERLAWWDTMVDNDGVIVNRSVIGKIPAWLEYMTAVDKTYGDFANTDMDENGEPLGKAFMVLNRNYQAELEDTVWNIGDVTTYIDPTKYNYAFAYSSLDTQNFWTEIKSHIIARRKMSAKQIPNI